MVGKHEYMNIGPRIYRVCYATDYCQNLKGIKAFDCDSVKQKM